MTSEESHDKRHCLNCGAILTGKYCAACGQKDLPSRQKIGELLVNFLGSFTSFESKFFNTLRYLLFKPGFLATEYNDGKREKYYHPARAYVFCSFIFFLMMSWSSADTSDLNLDFTMDENGQKVPFIVDGDTLEQEIRYDTLLEYNSVAEYDSIQLSKPESERDGWVKRFFKLKSIELNLRYKGRGTDFMGDMINGFKSNFPKVFFILLPVFAGLLKLLYVRHDYYYSEHLVFSTVFYNFFFLDFTLAVAVGNIPFMGWFKVVALLWIPVYFLMAMKGMYLQSWLKTSLKTLLFMAMFSFFVAIGLMANFIFTLTQM